MSHTSLTGKVTGTYDAQDRLITYGAASYFYTANGELQAKVEGSDTTRYTYDAFGNLVQVRMPNADLIEYIIDGQNRRVGKKLNGVVVKRWLYEGQLRPVGELDSAGNVTARYVYGMKVNVPEYIAKDTVTYRVITDHLGSVRIVVDQGTGAIAQQMDYDEWGNVLVDSNPDFTPFGFAGGLFDTQTRLVRFGARDYDGSQGALTTKDPIQFAIAGSSTYTYANADPINFVDPTGQMAALSLASDISARLSVAAAMSQGISGSLVEVALGLMATVMVAQELSLEMAKHSWKPHQLPKDLDENLSPSGGFEKMPQGDNDPKNKQFKEALKLLGIKEGTKTAQELHRAISKQGLKSLKDIVEFAKGLGIGK